jgi:hypothetical protein
LEPQVKGIMKRTSRKPSALSDSLQRHLNAYALAASAAGVGMLALAQPAEAKIVYTPSNKKIPRCREHPELCYRLDLNHDGTPDFTIPWYPGTRRFGALGSYLLVRPAENRPDNKVWGGAMYTNSGDKWPSSVGASALGAGITVGPNPVKFQAGHIWMWGTANACNESGLGCSFGQWKDVQNKYLGFRFYIGAAVHYGWARLSTRTEDTRLRAILTGYAYETIPKKPIITGHTKGPDVITLEPGSLGALAAGRK